MASTKKRTLKWLDDDQHNHGEDLIVAYSGRTVQPPATSSYFVLEFDPGYRPGRPNVAASWGLRYILQNASGSLVDGEVDLGRHRTMREAKDAAERYEATGEMPPPPAPYTDEQYTLALAAVAAMPLAVLSPEAVIKATLTALAEHGHIRR